MTRYSVEPDAEVPHSKSRGSHLRVHFKHCREIVHHIQGMPASKASKFLEDVLERKAIVPFTKYTGGIGRKAMAKQSDDRYARAGDLARDVHEVASGRWYFRKLTFD